MSRFPQMELLVLSLWWELRGYLHAEFYFSESFFQSQNYWLMLRSHGVRALLMNGLRLSYGSWFYNEIGPYSMVK
jgi:hypothetical protein